MWSAFLLLAACQTPPTASASASPAPGDWFYAGEVIDPASIRYDGPDVVFRTLSAGLRSGPVEGAARLACGIATRATLTFDDGELVEVFTAPTAPCVEAAALAADWSGLALEGVPLADAGLALVVYDVPAEAPCSSCS